VNIVSTVARPDLVEVAAGWIWEAFWREDGYTLPQIRACDLDARADLTPWLAAMYVRPEARGRGYARALIRAVENEAARAGYDGLWLYTLRAEGLYLKAGWRTVERIVADGRPATLMRRDLRKA
jgi:GNAT superfamily N-acetyltransferase